MRLDKIVRKTAEELKTTPENLLAIIKKFQGEIKELEEKIKNFT